MGGGPVDEIGDWEVKGPSGEELTMVLVGRTGNGKSATANSIIGHQVFDSQPSSSGVTVTCGVERALLSDGRILNVVDTPGLFDPAVRADFLRKEIVKCIKIAKDGLHCFLLVLSVRNRFTEEEAAAIDSLQMLFGEKFFNYLVIVFTGGDDLKAAGKKLEHYLNRCPPELQAIISKCNMRTVLFNNRTDSETEKANQRAELLKHIDAILALNEGTPYSDELLPEDQARSEKLCTQQEHDDKLSGYSKEESESLYAEQLKQLTEMVEEKLKIATKKLEQRLAQASLSQENSNEEIHMLQASLSQENSIEEIHMLQARISQEKSDEEIRKLHEKLQVVHEEIENLKNVKNQVGGKFISLIQQAYEETEKLKNQVGGKCISLFQQAYEETGNLKNQVGGKCTSFAQQAYEGTENLKNQVGGKCISYFQQAYGKLKTSKIKWGSSV